MIIEHGHLRTSLVRVQLAAEVFLAATLHGLCFLCFVHAYRGDDRLQWRHWGVAQAALQLALGETAVLVDVHAAEGAQQALALPPQLREHGRGSANASYVGPGSTGRRGG